MSDSGEFNLSQRDLEAIFGSGLIDGNYQLRLQVQNGGGTTLATDLITFTVDQSAQY